MAAISYDPKIDGFMQSLRLENDIMPVEQVDSAELIKLLEDIWSAKEQKIAQVAQYMEIIAQQAKAPAKVAAQLLKRYATSPKRSTNLSLRKTMISYCQLPHIRLQ